MKDFILNLYEIGRRFNLRIASDDQRKKLSFVFFPYTADEVISTSIIIAVASVILSLLSYQIMSFIGTTILFVGIILAIITYVYPFNIYYSNEMMVYSEEMLRAIMHLSNYIQTGSSMEYAFLETAPNVEGTLGKQFREIVQSLQRKKATNLGEAIKPYIDVWNESNPQFVKGLRLLQIAALSDETERDRLIAETTETMMLDYMVLGKRSAEELSKNTNMLIAGGILVPILSLLVLPILAVFMPSMVRPGILAFVYNVFFPTIVLIAAFSFAAKRVQVDTINMQDSKDYEPLPSKYIYLAIGIAIVFFIISIPGLKAVLEDPAATLDSTLLFTVAWLVGAGAALAIYTYTTFYVKKYERIWNQVREIEEDLPFILQSFSTYFTLNTPFESVINGVIDDYQNLGFKKHPAVSSFKKIKDKLMTSKEGVSNIIRKQLKSIFPSRKVRSVIKQIVSYEQVSQESAAKASRMIRQQVINTYKVDDYIKTLLSDTVGLMKVSINMLAPLLCSAAVVMTYAILKSIVFITDQLKKISQLFGGQEIELNLVDTTQVISPIIISAIVGIYFIEMLLVLSVFQTQIATGSDNFQIVKTVKNNVTSFLLYSLLLFVGYVFVNILLFKNILQA